MQILTQRKIRKAGNQRYYYYGAFLFLVFLWNLHHIRGTETENEAPAHLRDLLISEKYEQILEKYEKSKLMASITNNFSRDAISRAKSDNCRHQLTKIAYLREYNLSMIQPVALPRTCPLEETSKYRQYVGCYADHPKDRLLRGGAFTLKEKNSIDNCINQCILIGHELAGVQRGSECLCGLKESLKKTMRLTNEDACQSYPCSGNKSEFCGGHKVVAVYETGIGKTYPINVKFVDITEKVDGPPIKIVFLLEISGRSSRQVKRMIKMIYRRQHFYYVHVDARHAFLYRQMLDLERVLPNFRVKRKRFASAWGGTSFLSMTLDTFKDLFDEFSDWSWDYVINLTESDLPLVTIDLVERFLRKYRGTNFLRSIGNLMAEFIKNQGFDRTFLECDQRMYLLGNRSLPHGLRLEGGSEWFGFTRDYIEFALSDDPFVVGLKKLYATTILPMESFFHTLAVNTRLCTTMASTNFRSVNWRRERGCRCLHRDTVDWCGCSPNVIKIDDWDNLKPPMIFGRLDFFARKFDAMIDQSIIRRVEIQVRDLDAFRAKHQPKSETCVAQHDGPNCTSTFGQKDDHEIPGLHAYWENHFDIIDQSMDELRKSNFATWFLLRSLARLTLQRFRFSSDQDASKNQCNVDKIQRLHFYQESDTFQGILVQFNGTCSIGENEARPWSLEALVKKFPNMTRCPNSDPLAEALLTLEAGSNFDFKEEMFRNYAGAMTVDDQIVIRHEWDTALLKNIKESDRNVKMVLLDPKDEIQGCHDEILKSPTGVEFFPLPPKNEKMKPGVWKVQLRTQDQTKLAETLFLLFPGDREEPEKSPDYIDFMINRFYRVTNICYAPTYDNPETVDKEKPEILSEESTDQIEDKGDKDGVQYGDCAKTYWSSFSPDPKSEIHGVDWKTGVIFP